jgi:hypothetical protein
VTAREVLAAVKSWPVELFEDWCERSAILEYDACLPREAAEVAAYLALRHKAPAKQTEMRL